VTRLTPERRAVLEHLAEVGEASPSEIARALGRGPGSTRELLRLMARDGRGVGCFPTPRPTFRLVPSRASVSTVNLFRQS
jgi:DNA-binding transcriptional ArsR family regulator